MKSIMVNEMNYSGSMSSPSSSPSNVFSSSLRCLEPVFGRGGSSPIGSVYVASIISIGYFNKCMVLKDSSLQYNSLVYCEMHPSNTIV